ncbi:MAG: flavin reductase family protein [Microthrixaceae bacterium]|nr:flavin reductase family protein [Microthrixaceae bacterium]
MEAQDKKVALRAITYGLYVMTSRHGDLVGGGGVNWLTQASFEPPLVAAAVRADSGLCATITAGGTFAVNVLAEDQVEIAKAFFGSTELDGERINGRSFTPGEETGAPILDEVPCWFECRVTDVVERGDHTVFVAEVVGAGVRDAEQAPLSLRSTGMSYGG